MRPLLICLTALLIAPHAGPVQAQAPTMTQIQEAFEAGDLAAARAGLTELNTQSPQPLIQFRLGRMLFEGLGGARDAPGGLALLQSAAANGQLGAMAYLGRVHLTAGPTRDPALAVRYFQQGAARGMAEAKYYLGLVYYDGVGVAQDRSLARTWMQAAAEDGYGPAQYELSKRLAAADPPQPEQAARWLTEAAHSGVPEAQFAMARDIQTKGGPITDVAALFASAAEGGHVPSQRALGTLYLTGAEGLEADGAQAEIWLRKAVEGRDLVALHNLGLGYLRGTVLPSRPGQAADLLTLASDNGFARSSLALARAHEEGTLGQADMGEALAFYRLAVEQGSPAAAEHLGDLILQGSDALRVPPHDAVPWVLARLQAGGAPQAQTWLEERAAQGVRPAQAALGAWLLDQPQDGPAQAQPYLLSAAEGGHVPSQFRLGRGYTTGVFGVVDYVAAHTWLNIAAASGHSGAATMRDTVTDLMTPDDIAQAQSAARAYFEAARNAPPVTGAPTE